MTAPTTATPTTPTTGASVLDLQAALDAKKIEPAVRQVVLAAAARTSCQPLDRSRNGQSVPCVAEQGTQVAAYPMRHRIAITSTPQDAQAWASRLGARLEPKGGRTTYLHLVKQQLEDPRIAQGAVEALVAALELCRTRPQTSGREVGAPELRDFGSCRLHGYAFNAAGLCPQCEGDF